MVVAVSQVGIACWCEPLQNEAERVLSRKSLELSVARSQPFETVNRNRGRASEFVGTNVRTEVERFRFHKVAKHIHELTSAHVSIAKASSALARNELPERVVE